VAVKEACTALPFLDHPAFRVPDRLVAADHLQADDAADDEPDGGGEDQQEADHDEHQDHRDQGVEQADPEGPDRPGVMCFDPSFGFAAVDVGQNDGDETTDADDKAAR
jgi:hypothetical protein